jgi:hypothetical protein
MQITASGDGDRQFGACTKMKGVSEGKEVFSEDERSEVTDFNARPC